MAVSAEYFNVIGFSFPFVVVPANGNVRTGVVFGPNGTEDTGTLVLPAIIDVKKNTQYGAAGTEFTGTLLVNKKHRASRRSM